LDFFLQLMVSAATASIVSAALAERIKLWPFLIFTIVLTGLIDPIQASWTSAGGFRDFAGSTVVHPVGGWAALAGAIILGPPIGTHRKDGKVHPMPGSNLALATLGSFNPWLCWFGFSGGSQRALGPVGGMADASRIFSNTNAAAADGAVAALIGGVIEVLAVPFLDKMKLDGVLGEIPVHLFADIWGTIAVVLTNPDASFVARIVSILVAGAFFFVVSAAVWPIPKATMGLLVSEEAEVTGLDTTEPGMAAHPEFAKG
jgi:Amt family ammonium transporter